MAETTQKNSDTSFLDEKKGPKLHIKDILFIILRNIHWLVLCGAAGALIAGYSVRHQNRVYESTAQLLIKGSTTGNTENSIREASVSPRRPRRISSTWPKRESMPLCRTP